MKTCPFLPFTLLFCTLVLPLAAQVPGLLNYQGRIAVGSTNFDGNGQFKFALVNGTGSTTYWSNDGTSTAGSQPTAAVTLAVTKGLYSVQLGDTTLANMTALPATVFANTDVRLRVWFNDGTTGFQLLTPDKRIAAVGYAMMAETVPDGAITATKIAPGAVGSSQLASGLTLTGNLTGNATNFTGPLMGDVTGTQSATVVSSVGGSSATNVNAATVAANSATAANTPGSIIRRDASGNFSAGTMTGNITGSAASFTGALAGDVTGTQSATSISPTTVTSKTLVGFSSAPGAVTASDSILSALGKINGNVATRAPLASPTFTGTLTLPLGTASSAPLILQAGSNLTTPVFGAVEFDGSNVHVTNNTASPTRKTLSYTDTPINAGQIGNGLITQDMMAPGSAAANLAASGQAGVPSGGVVLSRSANDVSLMNLGFINLGKSALGEILEFRPSTGNPPSVRAIHSAIWTGTEMIIWGGYNGTTRHNDGGRYNPATNTWMPLNISGAPAGRIYHTAVWTGSEIIVWGGGGNTTDPLNDGGRYNPATDSWSPINSAGAPSARKLHSAVWTGTEMIVWGGWDGTGRLGDGARYNPTTDSWTPVSSSGVPSSRFYHTAVWTGTEMLVWGGGDFGSYLNDGGRYNPSTNSWVSINTGSAPSARREHIAVWTGSEMVIWGGYGGSYLSSGGRYSPVTNSWTPTAAVGIGGRIRPAAVWTGKEVIIWGGYDGTFFNTGAMFNPGINTWRTMSSTVSPAARYHHTAIWTGGEMVIWGGNNTAVYHNDTINYSPPKEVYLYQKP